MSAPVVVIDTIARSVTVNDQPIKASHKEFELLALLASDPERAFSKDEILALIWPGHSAIGRTLDSHACRIRRRLAAAGADGFIDNIYGHGYRLARVGRGARLVQAPQSPPPGTSGDAAAELLRLARETVARVRVLAGAEGDMATDLFAADAAAALKRASEIRVGRHRDRKLAAVA